MKYIRFGPKSFEISWLQELPLCEAVKLQGNFIIDKDEKKCYIIVEKIIK